MEGKRPSGVLVVLVNNKAEGRDDEFNKWYDEVHLGEVCGTGAYYAATRYVNTKPVLDPGEARFLAIYETDWKDPEAAFAHMQTKTKDMNIWPHIGRVHVKTYSFISEHKPKQAKAAAKVKPARRKMTAGKARAVKRVKTRMVAKRVKRKAAKARARR